MYKVENINQFQTPTNNKKKILYRKPQSQISQQKTQQKIKHQRNNSGVTQFKGFYSPNLIEYNSKDSFFEQLNKKQIKSYGKTNSQQTKQSESELIKNEQQNMKSLKQLQKRIFLKSNINESMKKQSMMSLSLTQKIQKQTANKKNNKSNENCSSTSNGVNEEYLRIFNEQLDNLRSEMEKIKRQNDRLKKYSKQLQGKVEQLNKLLKITIKINKQEQQRIEDELRTYIQQNKNLKRMINEYEFTRQKKSNECFLLKKQNKILKTKVWALKQHNSIIQTNGRQDDEQQSYHNYYKQTKHHTHLKTEHPKYYPQLSQSQISDLSQYSQKI